MNPKIYYGNREQPYFARHNDRPNEPERPRDTVLSSKRMHTERKSFTLEVRENHRGRFLSIVEEGRSRSMIIVPADGLAEFKNILNDVIAAAEAKPSSPPAPDQQP